MSTALPVELDDIQGLVRFGYKHHTEALFLLLRVTDREAARRWLAAVPVCTAETVEPPPETALQIALTADGLRALGVADTIIDAFAAEFVAGMAGDANRARRLGDVGANDPSRWRWGAGARTPHVAVLLYALPGKLAAFQSAIEAQCGGLRARGVPDDHRHGRHRAFRLRRRHLAAGRRLAARAPGEGRRANAYYST